LLSVPIRVFVEVTYTLKVALALLLVASTLNRWLPASYSATWIETVSAAVVGVREGVAEAVLVGVGSAEVGVAVGRAVGVRVAVAGAEVGVEEGPVAVGVRVGEASGGASRLISNERTDDQVPFVPPPVRARTRHQKRRSLVKVCVVWVWVSPV